VTFTLSPPVRYAALLGLLAVVLGAGAMMMLGRGGDSGTTPHVIKRHPFGTHVKKSTTKLAAPKATTPKAATPKPVSPVPAAPKVPEQASAVIAALAAGVPTTIAKALGQHQVVVVSLYNPYSKVDAIAFAEARAGARLAGAGFVSLNVLSQAQVGKLTEQLGLLPDPGLLVYTRPGTLLARISGFVDKETVAQAAQNAAHAS
jgi:hypothetical protein